MSKQLRFTNNTLEIATEQKQILTVLAEILAETTLMNYDLEVQDD